MLSRLLSATFSFVRSREAFASTRIASVGSLAPSACASSPPHAPHAPHPEHAHGHPAGEGGHAMHHRFEHAEEWARLFDDPARDAWQRPEEVIATMKLRPKDVVADIGAGTGYFTMRIARAIPEGHVFAVDLEPDMVRYLEQRAHTEGMRNVTPVLATTSNANIPKLVDFVLVVDTFHHIDQRPQYVRKLGDSLAPGGRIGIIDYAKESKMGPPPEFRLRPEQVQQEMQAAGFTLVEPVHNLPNQYFLLFSKAP
jgi:cyclopropane fatty-acyl-phospholipid synthase-like methyltransferase